MITLNIPKGFNATGEVRTPKDGEWFCNDTEGLAVQASSEIYLTGKYNILTKTKISAPLSYFVLLFNPKDCTFKPTEIKLSQAIDPKRDKEVGNCFANKEAAMLACIKLNKVFSNNAEDIKKPS